MLVYQFGLHAQNVEFVVKDSLTANFVREGTINIHDVYDKTNAKLTTDNKGKAVWWHKNFPVEVIVEISAPNYRLYQSDTMTIKENDTLIYEINKINNVIEEVIIDDLRTLRYSRGKITYVPRKTTFNQTQSITELFPSIPGVSKRNGQYYFRNESNYLILIDGVGENKSKEEQLSILENMPVNSIIRIDLIDQPSVRYGNNITGVINVITKEDISYAVARVGGNIQNFSDAGNSKVPLSVNGNINSKFRIGRTNFQVALRLNQNEQFSKKYNNVAYYPNSNLEQTTISSTKLLSLYPYLSIDHTFNKRFSGQVSTYFSANDIKERGTSVYQYFLQNMPDSSFKTNDLSRNSNLRFVVTPQLSYKLDTARNTILYFNSTLAFMGSDHENDYQLVKGPKGDNQFIYSRLSSNTKILYFDIIGENLFNSKVFNLTAGAKSNFLKNSPRYDQNFKYEEFVNNLFISSEINFPKAKLTTGLRAEILKFQHESENIRSKETITNLFPSFKIQRELGSEKNASLGYQRNILRMSSIAYNTQVMYKGFLNGTIGNSDLQPRITNYFYLQFYLKSHVFSINYKIHNNHRIFVPLDSLQPYIMQAVSYNYFKQLYINYNKDFEIGKFWKSNVGLYCYFNRMDNDQLSFKYKRAINYSIDWYNTLNLNTYMLELGFNYNSPYRTESGIIRPILYNNLALSKTFKNNIWNIRISINDFLGVSKEKSIIDLPLLYRSEGQLNNQQSFGVQLTYRFPFGTKTLLNQYKSDLSNEIRN